MTNILIFGSIVIILFFSLLYLADQTYIKVDHGNIEKQNKKINFYIWITVAYQTITTMLILICLSKLL